MPDPLSSWILQNSISGSAWAKRPATLARKKEGVWWSRAGRLLHNATRGYESYGIRHDLHQLHLFRRTDDRERERKRESRDLCALSQAPFSILLIRPKERGVETNPRHLSHVMSKTDAFTMQLAERIRNQQ